MSLGKIFTALSTVAALSIPAMASAQEERHRFVGIQADTGIPDGATLGLVIQPIPVDRFDWFQLNLSGSYNGLAPGVRAGLTFDPLPWRVFAPTLTGEMGHAFTGSVPGISNPPSVSYDYLNAHLGLSFGHRSHWRFFIRGGVSYINLSATNVQGSFSLPSGVSVGNPNVSGIMPSAKIGFDVVF